MSKRSETSQLLLALTWQQQSDLLLFERFKKWTPALLARVNYLDQSSANRRLHRLLVAGMLAVRRGQPLPGGGRQPDLYYPTASGARAITQLQHRGGNYVTPPDVSNLFDNDHDLAALEIAVRSGQFHEARAFEKRDWPEQGTAGKVIPDVYFPPNVFSKAETFVEIEQTERPEHIRKKYTKYARLSRSYHLNQKPLPRLIVVFPTERICDLLYRNHVAAAQAAAQTVDCACTFTYAILDELRQRDVRRFERKTFGNEVIEIEGLLQCLYDLIN